MTIRRKHAKLFGRAINRYFLDMDMEDDVALVEYMIDYIKAYDIDYMIREVTCLNKKYIEIRVDCDDEMMRFLRNIMENFEYDWEAGMALV